MDDVLEINDQSRCILSGPPCILIFSPCLNYYGILAWGSATKFFLDTLFRIKKRTIF